MPVVNIATYMPEAGDSVRESQNIFAAELGMLQWLTRGYGVENVSDEARCNSYYNEALWRMVINELMPHLHNPSHYHILYAKHLILNLRKYRYVPGDERGVIVRSAVQQIPNESHRRKRGKRKSRTVVQGHAQWLAATTRAVDQSLVQAAYNRMPFVLIKNNPLLWATSESSSGNAEILIQCGHGHCQRYIPVHDTRKWCRQCEAVELHAQFMVNEDENGDRHCTSCLDESTTDDRRINTQ